MALGAGAPDLRPEGYTELVGDILIDCTGGSTMLVGAAIPTTNLIVYMSPSVPITSRLLGLGTETLLIIDEAGSGEITGATGGYGPQAPQALCTTVQQENQGGSACPTFVGVDNSGNYQVSVVAPGSTMAAANVYQGKVGDFGVNSVAFYNVPVLPPASSGVSRIFHITNIRVPVPGFISPGTLLQAFISSSGNQSLPLLGTTVDVGIVGPPTLASVNASPAGGGNPFSTCAPVTTPALTSQITFTEGFATAFKTRVVPGGAGGGNTIWAAEAQNLVSPANQNIPGGNYGGFSADNESGFILPALAFTDSTSNITYTAGLADFGTRLKAVFTNIPAGVTVYVSTANSATVTMPGGTSVTPYAVLVAAGQTAEANNDGSAFTPLTSAITGSDGLSAYPLEPDNSGATAAIWEVVNANSGSQDVLTFSVYIAYGSTLGTPTPTNVALSYAPEPGGGSFTIVNAASGLTSPLPRFGILGAQGGPFATINLCAISVYGGTPVNFAYPIGGSAPSAQILEVATSPSNLTVTVTPSVTTPSGGSWLSASLNSGILSFSINPANLAASPTAYTGSVKLSAAGQSVSIPVTLTVYPPAQFTVTSSHSVNFAQGQSGSYSVAVSNASQSSATTGSVTVTESFSSGLSLGSMNGTGWNCNTVPTCYRTDSLNPAASFDPISVTVNVAPNATSPQTNTVDLSSPGLLDVFAYDPTVVTSKSCDVKQIGSFTVADAQYIINEALGVSSAGNDLNFDGVVNVADIQLVLNAVMTQVCVI
jgi:hypothetical protein